MHKKFRIALLIIFPLLVISIVVYGNWVKIILWLMVWDGSIIIRNYESVSFVPLRNGDVAGIRISSLSDDRRIQRDVELKDCSDELRKGIEDWLSSVHENAFRSFSDFVPEYTVMIPNKIGGTQDLITIYGGIFFIYDVGGTNQYIRIGNSEDRKVVDLISAAFCR